MLTAIILTKNEERNIKDAVQTVAFCDEVLVIDNGSTDQTIELARQAGARVMHNASSKFSKLRNDAENAANGAWLLYIDADERIPAALCDEIKAAVEQPTADAYFLRREDVFWGKPLHHGEVRNAYIKGLIRLVRKGSGTWKGDVHEFFDTKGKTARLNNTLRHYAHTGIKDFLESINLYSTLRADELYVSKASVGMLDLTLRPAMKFIYTYFILAGFRDGAGGFVYSFMMSFHAFLVRSKLYLKYGKAQATT